MSEKTPGSTSVLLVKNPTNSKRNLAKCLICQHVKGPNGSAKLTSTDEGRQVIIDMSEKLEDGLVAGIELSERCRIQYHVKSCYSTYRKKGERHDDAQKRKAEDQPEGSPLTSPVTRPKRPKPVKSKDPRDKGCKICDHSTKERHKDSGG